MPDTGIKQQSPSYYDMNTHLSLLPLDKSPWRPLYEALEALIPYHNPSITDLGCGAGRFAALLKGKGYTEYAGWDFSSVMIEEARKTVPEYLFIKGDVKLFHPVLFKTNKPGEKLVYIVSEILEHLEDDMGLIRKLPEGSTIIGSVPNHWSVSHVRTFEDEQEVVDRYSGLIDFDMMQVIPLNDQKRFFVFRGVRND